ncbi:glutamate formimidoyltransferase [bacterium]|nr:MAG: glutamate formimidoyltransferase [bacterium]
MTKIIECVPNFSEGKNKETIEAIASAIRNTDGCTLLDVDPGASTNRTVYTFVGDEKSIIEGALASAKVGKELIDMRKQNGEHPRMGALDVCPFVPVANVTMEECVEISKKFAERASKELGLTIYLYEYSSERDYRKKLPDIRKGEYEAMAEKVKQSGWEPDYWSGNYDPKWGCTATGARKFLIAYNINVLGTWNQAHRIALNLREAGRGDGEQGRLKETKALGWHVEEYNMAQISMNLNDYHITPMHIAYEEAKKDAIEMNLGLAGSEIVGLVPLEAMLMAADYYMKKENLFIIDESQKINLVVDRLGLSSIHFFDPNKRIIEYIIKQERNEPLASMSVRDFIGEVAARSSAPGGGSVSAAIASLGAGLGTMVAWLTFGYKKFEEYDGQLRRILPKLVETTQELIPLIDADTNAFGEYMDALRLPQETEDEIQTRKIAMENGMKVAIEIPLKTMKTADKIWEELIEVAKIGNFSSRSDIEVGVRALEVGIWGAYRNVVINLPNISDEEFKIKKLQEAESIANRAKEKMQEILDIISNRKN